MATSSGTGPETVLGKRLTHGPGTLRFVTPLLTSFQWLIYITFPDLASAKSFLFSFCPATLANLPFLEHNTNAPASGL